MEQSILLHRAKRLVIASTFLQAAHMVHMAHHPIRYH
jgi:hypothetical protein